MNDLTFSAGILVHLAALFYVAGFLVKDQLMLRMLVFAGTLLYLVYYYFALDTPLWDAIFWSVVMGTANLFIMVQLAMERTTFSMSEEDKALYAKFDTMTPGEFRKLMKIAKRSTSDGTTAVLIEGEAVESLHFVEAGQTTITKQGQSFKIASGSFLGEVGFFLNQPASASAVIDEGGSVVTWEGEALKKLQAKNPGIRAALYGLMSADMAGKVANSIGGSTAEAA